MSAPNIEMIIASLRSCSLEGGRGVLSPPVDSPPAGGEEVTVELNSEVALPYQWQQCLDIKTGEIYYVNWKDGTRTTEDPRLAGDYPEDYPEDASYSSESCYDSEDSVSDDGIGDEYIADTADSSSSTAYSPDDTAAEADPAVLVAAGCKSCFMYFMVPKHQFTCPKCVGHLSYF